MNLSLIERIKRKLAFGYLDLVTIPTIFMNKKQNALYHLDYVCPRCPIYRRQYRDVYGSGRCWWNEQWKKGNYEIPRNFGFNAYVRSYLGLKTDLSEFKGKEKGR